LHHNFVSSKYNSPTFLCIYKRHFNIHATWILSYHRIITLFTWFSVFPIWSHVVMECMTSNFLEMVCAFQLILKRRRGILSEWASINTTAYLDMHSTKWICIKSLLTKRKREKHSWNWNAKREERESESKLRQKGWVKVLHNITIKRWVMLWLKWMKG